MKKMEEIGFEVTYLPVVGGYVDVENFARNIKPTTGLASIMCVNNEIGTKNNISEISDICVKEGVLLHSDCVQAAGLVLLADIDADLISVSGHKIHAPKGTGCLYVKNKGLLSSVVFGGKQEFGLRGGTENVAGIVAFGEAMKNACKDWIKNIY